MAFADCAKLDAAEEFCDELFCELELRLDGDEEFCKELFCELEIKLDLDEMDIEDNEELLKTAELDDFEAPWLARLELEELEKLERLKDNWLLELENSRTLETFEDSED